MRLPANRTSPHVEVIPSLTIFVRFQKMWTKFLTSQLCLLMIVDIDESYPTATATPPRPRRDPPPTDRHRPTATPPGRASTPPAPPQRPHSFGLLCVLLLVVFSTAEARSDQVIRKLLNVSPLSDFCDAICFAATLRDRFQPLLIPTQSSN